MATTTKKKSKSDEIRRRVAYLEAPLTDDEQAYADDIARCLARLESRRVSRRESLALYRVFIAADSFYERVLSAESFAVIERELQVILSENGIENPTARSLRNAPELAWAAAQALSNIRIMRCGEETAVASAFALGMLLMHLRDRLDWPDAKDGRAQQRARRKGAQSVAAKHAKNWAGYQREVDRLVLGGNSYNSACVNAAKKFHCDPITIRRRTVNPAKT